MNHNHKTQSNLVYKNIYNHLKEYMFYPDVIHKNMNIEYNTDDNSHKNNNKIKNNIDRVSSGTRTNVVVEPIKETPFFIPQEKDKLFWCFYIFVQGEYEYNIAKNNRFAIEKKWKMDTMAKLNDVKEILKTNKIKVADLEDELMNKEKLSLNGLQVFCMIYEMSILYVSGRKFCEFIYNNEPDAKTFVIFNMDNKEDGIHRNPDDAFIKNIRDTYWKMENVNKPLKGVSAYSLNELQEISTKMGILLEDTETKKKKTMKILYQELLKHF